MTNISPEKWLGHARLRLDDARFLQEDGRRRTATVQIYFALYYACRALLEERDFYFERHASVTSNVGRVQRYREQLDTSFPTAMQYRRERCDYELYTPDSEAVQTWMTAAGDFIEAADALLS